MQKQQSDFFLEPFEFIRRETKQVLCHIRISHRNGALWFCVLYNNQALPFRHITSFPYRLDKNGIFRICAMLGGLIADSSLLVLEGSSLLREKDRYLLTAFLSDYSVQNQIAFLQIEKRDDIF